MIIDEHINKLPQSIGLYLFKKEQEYLYIGKSLNIRQRVHNHKERVDIDLKEKAIIENSDSIEHIICSSEFHALILESQLIQKYRPPYNIVWKDDKSYLYIKIPIKDPFPRISLVRKERDEKSLLFGPFSSTKDVRFLLRSIRKVVPFCTQKQPIKKPCFYSKIGLCDPCPGMIKSPANTLENREIKKRYRAHIRKIVSLLKGGTDSLLHAIKKEISSQSSQEHYEEAIDLRNKLFSLEELIHLRSFEQFEYSNTYDPEVALRKLKEIIDWIPAFAGMTHNNPTSSLSRIECYDISNLMQKDATASMVVATNGILDKAEYKQFKIKKSGVSDFKMLTEAITRRMNNDWAKPDLIVVDGGAPQVTTIERTLKRLNMHVPLIGIAKRPDRIVALIPGGIKTYKFSLHNEGFQLIQQLRDESHRFAKKYHTYLRGKKYIKS